MKLYIAGPMTGLPDHNYPAFFEAEEQLKAAGYEIENPARNEVHGDASWLGFVRMSLVQISRVDGIALLPGWSTSKGARIEEDLGQKLGFPVRYVRTWLEADMLAAVREHEAAR